MREATASDRLGASASRHDQMLAAASGGDTKRLV
jgi:hypothetical protein